VGVEALNAVAGRQPLLQQRRELLRELLPVLVAHLLLEAVQEKTKHTKQPQDRLSKSRETDRDRDRDRQTERETHRQRQRDTHLVEHVPQVILGVDPGGHRIAEEDKVLHRFRVGELKSVPISGIKTN